MSRPIANPVRVRCLAELIRQGLAEHLDGERINDLLLDPLREQCPLEYQIGAASAEIRLAIIRALALLTIDFQQELAMLKDGPGGDYHGLPEDTETETWAKVAELWDAEPERFVLGGIPKPEPEAPQPTIRIVTNGS